MKKMLSMTVPICSSMGLESSASHDAASERLSVYSTFGFSVAWKPLPGRFSSSVWRVTKWVDFFSSCERKRE